MRVYAQPKYKPAIMARKEYEFGRILEQRFPGKVKRKYTSLEAACRAHGVDSKQVREHTGALMDDKVKDVVKDIRTAALNTDFTEIEESTDGVTILKTIQGCSQSSNSSPRGRKPKLDRDQEDKIVKWVQLLRNARYPVSIDDIIKYANARFNVDVGTSWYHKGLKKRIDDLGTKKVKSMSRARCEWTSSTNLNDHFDTFEELVTTYGYMDETKNLTEKGSRMVISFDETSLSDVVTGYRHH